MINTYYIRLISICLLCLMLVSGRIRVNAQEIITVKQGSSEKEILILPYYTYPLDTTLFEKDEVSITKFRKGKTGFNDQLYKAALETASDGGNVFMINKMQDHNQKGKYKIWGKAYYYGNYEQLKTKAFALKNKTLENGKYGYLIIYRPLYHSGFNDDIDMELTINDTLKLNMKATTKYMIQISKDCDVKIADREDEIVKHVHVLPGKKYYVRAYTNIPGSHKTISSGEVKVMLHRYTPYFETIDDVQGGLESSLVNLITISKKLGN